MKFSIALFAMLAIYSVSAQKSPYLLVGTYTSGKSEGIYVYSFNTANAGNHLISIVKTSNPSYLAVSPNKKFVYAVNEDADTTGDEIGGHVSSFSFDAANGKLTKINKQFSGGKNPCYVAVDKTGRWALAGNYSSGNLAVLGINKNGSLKPLSQLIQHSGTGPNTDRQEGPHVHSTVLSKDNNYLFVPDLGIDKVMIYHFNKLNGKLSAANPPFAPVTEGAGPRHFEFHPNNQYAYLMQELTGMVAVFTYKNGRLNPIQEISAIPTNFTGAIGSADIHVSADGKFLYCSNRGESNTITIFSVHPATGKLSVAGYQSTLGKTPRNFNFDPTGNFLLVANQNSDDVVIFKINKKTGLLTDTGKRINVPNPVCVKWIVRD